jgi:uncharacterized protein YjbJ (UPF0337 family)
MDKDRVKGAINDAAGRAKRQVGEWTGDRNAQVEGATQQLKGKAQKAWGTVKDAARDASQSANRKPESGVQHESVLEREREAIREEERDHVHSGHSR